MLILSEISVSRARLARILGACGRAPDVVVDFYRPVGLVHQREHYFLDVVDAEGNIQGSVAAGDGWAGAMVWTNLHEIRRALRQRQDAFVCLQVGHETLLVDGRPITYSDPLKGLDIARAAGGPPVVEFEEGHEPVLVLGIDDTADAADELAATHDGATRLGGEGKPAG